MSVSQSSKKNLGPKLNDPPPTKVPSIQNGQRICGRSRKTIVDLPKSFENEAVASSSLEYDISEKEDKEC
jgi:hypothetical protein